MNLNSRPFWRWGIPFSELERIRQKAVQYPRSLEPWEKDELERARDNRRRRGANSRNAPTEAE